MYLTLDERNLIFLISNKIISHFSKYCMTIRHVHMCHHKTCPSSLFMTWGPLLLILLISWYSYQGGAHFLSHVFDPFLIGSATFTVGVHSTGKKKDRSTSFWRWVSPRTPKTVNSWVRFWFLFEELSNYLSQQSWWINQGEKYSFLDTNYFDFIIQYHVRHSFNNQCNKAVVS